MDTDDTDYFCTKCNTQIEYGQLKCPSCGDTLEWDDIEISEEQETSASVTAKRYATTSIIFVFIGFFILTPVFASLAIILGFKVKDADESTKTVAKIGVILGATELVFWIFSVILLFTI